MTQDTTVAIVRMCRLPLRDQHLSLPTLTAVTSSAYFIRLATRGIMKTLGDTGLTTPIQTSILLQAPITLSYQFLCLTGQKLDMVIRWIID